MELQNVNEKKKIQKNNSALDQWSNQGYLKWKRKSREPLKKSKSSIKTLGSV